MATPVIMPRQGQSVETCIITCWNKKKGDPVHTGDILFSYETDKAAFDEEAKADGILLEVFFAEGDEVPVLTNVAVIGQAGEDAEQFRPGKGSEAPQVVKETAPEVSKKETTQPVPAIHAPAGKKRISPRARMVAADLGVDPQTVTGSGPEGRVIERDIRKAAQEKVKAAPVSVQAPVQPAAPTFSYTFQDEVKDIKLSNVRRIISNAMHASLQNSAQLTHHTSADARKIMKYREKVKEAMAKGNTANITLNDMVCYATIKALKKWPAANVHFLGDSIRQFQKIHLGMAVDTERGLMVPVLRDADDLNIQALSHKLHALSESCKKGNISPELLASTAGTFTVSNLGSYGVEIFTPIINVPQVGILGVDTITYRPAEIGNGVIGFIPVIGLSLTYDHRAIDGAPASAFLREIRQQIENIEFTIE